MMKLSTFESCVSIFMVSTLVAAEWNITKDNWQLDISSTLTYPTGPLGHNWDKSYAADGDFRRNPDGCSCCTGTLHEDNPWLQVDLGMLYSVSTVTVYGRTDTVGNSLRSLQIFLKRHSNSMGSPDQTTKQLQDNDKTVIFSLLSYTDLQYFTIRLPGTALLVVCEFQVSRKCPTGKYGVTCDLICNCANMAPCGSTGMCPGNECAYGWYGPSCNKTNSIALHKHVTLSSSFTGWLPEYATDDTIRTDADDCSCCAATKEMVNPWLQVDLGSRQKISSIYVYARTDKHEPYQLYTGLKVYLQQQSQTSLESLVYTEKRTNDTALQIVNVTLERPKTTQYITIILTGTINRLLVVCDLQVFPGVCRESYYGEDCDHVCHCNGQTCDDTTGICPSGKCQPGFQLPNCSIPCNDGSYGTCSQSCGECTTSTCNKTDGYCNDCKDGFMFPLCQTECDTGTYGHLCNETCGNCLNINECNTEDGTCPVCQDGYQGPKCDTPCTNGHFGFNCSDICTNCNNTECNIMNGTCYSGCSKGFSGSKCEPTHNNENQQYDATDRSSPAVIVAGISVGLLVLIIVVAGLVFAKRKGIIGKPNQANRKSEQFSSLRNPELSLPVVEAKKPTIAVKPKTKATVKEQHAIPTVTKDYYSFTPRKDDIKLYQLWDYIKYKMVDGKKLFYEEFAQLDSGLVMEHKIAMLPENRVKNRYREMYAYDHSRVPLIANMEGESQYINACFIDGFEKPAKFIASQGATKSMVDDFWRMVWQQESNTIVMVTNLMEMGTEKCMQYWPTEGSMKFENISVKLIKEETHLDYVVRHLQVKENEDDYRQVTHYHFKSWPDKDVPDSSWCLVNFWRVVCADKKVKGPIVVHCSAGVGRTGTFIALDNIYNQALSEGNVRPLQIVEALRRQRVNMVQTKEQYVYLHEAVADALYFGTHFIWTKQFEDVFRFMKQADSTSSISRLETQYSLICESIEKREVQEENEYSTVDTISTELDAYRPKSMNCSKSIGGAIKAVFLPNISGLDAFVVTDTPHVNSCADFWTLIEDQNIKTIIAITSDTTAKNNVMRYIGSKGSPTVGKFDVNALDENKRASFIDRKITFKESNKDIDELTAVKMFEFSAWHDNKEVPGDNQSVLDLLDAVYRWQPQSTDKQPILVYSGEGINKSGIVCVLMNELHRMRQNGGQINIVESVKTMKQKDENLIASFEQYRYCHDVILHHINQTEVYQNI